MNDGWMLWLILVGLSIGVISAWLLLVRLPRDEEDVTAAERRHEAAWISDIIERHGGVAPTSLVEEVLDLHQAYLRDPRASPVPYAPEDAVRTGPTPPGPGDALAPPRSGPPPPPSRRQPPPGYQPPPRFQPPPGYQPPPGAQERSSTTR